MICNNQSRLLLQFHITGRCNLRCKHCYRTEGDTEPLSFEDVRSVIDQFIDLKNQYNKAHGINRKGHINITGGEPFIRKDIKEILRYLGSKKEQLSYGILSNGSFIDDEIIKLLNDTEVSFVQLSIDGNHATHDYLRAEGDYDRVFATARLLEENSIRTYISFTANKENISHLPEVAKECRRHNISKLWSDRLVPIGNGEGLQSLAINADDLHNYLRMLKKAQGGFAARLIHPKTRVTMNRALQFMNSKSEIYSCSAGNSLITVDEFGNIMPCRRMPIICSDIFSTTLSDVYFNHETFKKLRIPYIPEECSKCRYSYYCRGGARCQSFAKYGTFLRADPGCPIIENR